MIYIKISPFIYCTWKISILSNSRNSIGNSMQFKEISDMRVYILSLAELLIFISCGSWFRILGAG